MGDHHKITWINCQKNVKGHQTKKNITIFIKKKPIILLPQRLSYRENDVINLPIVSRMELAMNKQTCRHQHLF